MSIYTLDIVVDQSKSNRIWSIDCSNLIFLWKNFEYKNEEKISNYERLWEVRSPLING